MGVDNVVHEASMLDNHQDIWTHQVEITHMEDQSEKDKYGNYKEIQNLEEQGKYAPKEANYSSGKGAKREFSESIWND